MRGAIYLRISKDVGGNAAAVRRHEHACRELAARNGIDIVGVYCDNDISASTKTRRARPAYERLLSDARARAFEVIVAYSSSRLTRRPLELESQIELAEDYGIEYLYVQSPSIDLSTAQGRMVARQLAALDAAEAEIMSERIRAAKQHSAAAGRWLGGPRPYGYMPGGMVIKEDEAAVVARVTDQLLMGASLRSLVAELNAAGVRTATGRQWTGYTLRQVVLRPRNAGLIRVGDDYAEAQWTAIVPRPKWQALVRRLTDPSRRTNVHNVRRRWLGSGLYQCGRCGRPVSVANIGGIQHYACRGGDHFLSRRATHVDRIVAGAVIGWISRPDTLKQLTATEVDTELLSQEAETLRYRLDEQAAAFGDGLLTRAQFARNTQKIRHELNKVEAELAATVAGHPVADLLSGADIAAAWEELDVSRKRAIVDALCEVTLHPGRPGRPPGWRPGQVYFDPSTVELKWRS